jgi:hypothetical protein
MWNEDCNVDRTKLDIEALDVPKLHSKYFNFYSHEKLKLKKLERDMKVLLLNRYYYYTGKGTAEEYAENPLDVKVLKNEVNMYLESDPQILELQGKIDLQQEKVLTLKEIISNINNRNWLIRNAIEFQKFINGVS